MGEFRRHHSGLHTASGFIEVDDFVELDILVSFYHADEAFMFWKGDEFNAFFFHFSIGMKEVNFFESF
jgi:hypothetical protein